MQWLQVKCNLPTIKNFSNVMLGKPWACNINSHIFLTQSSKRIRTYKGFYYHLWLFLYYDSCLHEKKLGFVIVYLNKDANEQNAKILNA